MHRYLLSLYETLPCTHPQVEKSLSQYLEKNLDRVDISCALRLCEIFLDNDNEDDDTKRTLRVRLLVASNNLESAVSTSLCMSNVDLAKQCANRARDLPLRRKLWTLVAKHLLKTARHDKKSQSEIFRSLLELCEEKSSPLELENVMSLLGDICSADKTMRDMICELLRGDDKKRDEMRAGVRDLNDASKRIRDMTRDVRGVRARSARILIISLMIVSPSCLSLMISTRKSTLSLASLIYFALEHKRSECSLECYEILNSRFALDHRYKIDINVSRARERVIYVMTLSHHVLSICFSVLMCFMSSVLWRLHFEVNTISMRSRRDG